MSHDPEEIARLRQVYLDATSGADMPEAWYFPLTDEWVRTEDLTPDHLEQMGVRP